MAGQSLKQIHLDGTGDQRGRVFAQAKPEPGFKSDGSKHSGRIFNETQSVQDADDLVIQISLPTVKIKHIPETLSVQPYGERVHGEIPTIEIFLDRTLLHCGEGGRIFVIFRPCGGHIEPEAVLRQQDCRAESLMDLDPRMQYFTELSREADSVAFDHEIQIQILDAQQQISHTAADDKERHLAAVSQLTSLFQHCPETMRQATAQQLLHVATRSFDLCFGVTWAHRPHSSDPQHIVVQGAQQIRPRHDADDLLALG